MSWRESLWNETRKKTSIVLLRCTQCTEAYWDRYIGCRVGHSSNVATNFPDVHRWQLLQQLAMLSLNKLARQIKSQPVKLQHWPLIGPLRILVFPDASYRHNDDGSSQRGMTVFLAESRERSGSMIDYERKSED